MTKYSALLMGITLKIFFDICKIIPVGLCKAIPLKEVKGAIKGLQLSRDMKKNLHQKKPEEVSRSLLKHKES